MPRQGAVTAAKALLVSVALAASIATANAQNAPQLMPDYDIPALCAGKPDERACLSRQYVNRNYAAGWWARATPQAREKCVAAVNKFQDYDLLGQCLPGER